MITSYFLTPNLLEKKRVMTPFTAFYSQEAFCYKRGSPTLKVQATIAPPNRGPLLEPLFFSVHPKGLLKVTPRLQILG